MPDSNSLILLPPRQTARQPQDSNSTRQTKPSSDDSFGKKLEKAKKHKAQITIKKQVATTPVKTAIQPSKAKPTIVEADTSSENVEENPEEKPAAEKPQSSQEQEAVADEQGEPKSADQPKLLVAAQQADSILEKKPVKIQNKSSKSRGTDTATAINASHSQVTKVTAPSAVQKAQESKVAVTPVENEKADADDSAGDEDEDSTEIISTDPDGEFGTGKITAKNIATAKGNPSADPADIDADSASASSAAATAVLAQPVPVDVASTLTVTGSKTGSATDTPVVGVSPIAGLGLASSAGGTTTIGGKIAAPAVVTPQAQFVEDNHSKIVTSIQGQLMPHGGTMQIRLDPPELGPLSVTVNMRDGVMTASFETSNDDATKLLSHSLGQLKAGLEAAGVSVEKLQVEQASKRDTQSGTESDSKQSQQQQQSQSQQDQQRREMVQRMWRRLAGAEDPLDMVA